LCVHLKQYLCHVRMIQFPYLPDDYHNSIILQQHPFEILLNRNGPVLDYSFVLDFSVNHFLIPLIVFPLACISPPIIISSFFNYSSPLYYVRFLLYYSFFFFLFFFFILFIFYYFIIFFLFYCYYVLLSIILYFFSLSIPLLYIMLDFI